MDTKCISHKYKTMQGMKAWEKEFSELGSLEKCLWGFQKPTSTNHPYKILP